MKESIRKLWPDHGHNYKKEIISEKDQVEKIKKDILNKIFESPKGGKKAAQILENWINSSEK